MGEGRGHPPDARTRGRERPRADWARDEGWDRILNDLRAATDRLREQQKATERNSRRLAMASEWLSESAKVLRDRDYVRRVVYLPRRPRATPADPGPDAPSAQVIPFPGRRPPA